MESGRIDSIVGCAECECELLDFLQLLVSMQQLQLQLQLQCWMVGWVVGDNYYFKHMNRTVARPLQARHDGFEYNMKSDSHISHNFIKTPFQS